MFQSFRLIYLLLVFPALGFAQGSGNTLSFNGQDEAINLGDQVANSCRTIEMWFKPNHTINPTNTTPITLIGRDYANGNGASIHEFALSFHTIAWSNPGKLVFQKRVGGVKYSILSDADTWMANHWYHVAVSIDPIDGMAMYINGVKQQSTDPSTQAIGIQSGNQTDNVCVGKWGNVDVRYFHGEIDELRLWDSERSESEIREKMCSKLTGLESDLKAYYNFDSQDPRTLLDTSPNNFDGLLLNMDAGNRILSGAPIGDTSIYIYDNSGLAAQSLNLSSSPGYSFRAHSVNSPATGMHVYRVDELPNSQQNIVSPLSSDYFGVFLTERSGNFDVDYDFSDLNCSCPGLLSRNDNAEAIWAKMSDIHLNCTFQVSNQSSIGQDYRAEFIVDEDAPTVDLGNDTILCAGQLLRLDVSHPNASYLWQDNSTNPSVTLFLPGTYWVTLSLNGCTATDSILIMACDPNQFPCEPKLEMPNVFTSNYDGQNDFFKPVTKECIRFMNTTIYNRWGVVVFSTDHPEVMWDGTSNTNQNLENGTYYWLIQYIDFNGEEHIAKGAVALLR